MVLTERERQILQLHAKGLSDYRIAHKLSMETPNVTRSRKNALKKIERQGRIWNLSTLSNPSDPIIL